MNTFSNLRGQAENMQTGIKEASGDISPVYPMRQNDSLQRQNIYFVGNGPGKMSRDFLTITAPIFRRYGINAFRYDEMRQFSDAIDRRIIDTETPCVVVMVYHEEDNVQNLGTHIQHLCQKKLNCCRLIHPANIGSIIGNKILTNRTLTAAGVRCPKLIETTGHSKPVFQNAPNTTQNPVSLILPGQRLNPEMYNTEFIDTRYKYENDTYYSSIRVLCAGGVITSLFLRFRNIREQNPSVHEKDTPLLPDLINQYYYKKICPVKGQLADICKRIGDVYGLGAYVHDLALCAHTNNVYLLESGFKFHAGIWPDHIRSIVDKVVMDNRHEVVIIKLVYEFIRQLGLI